MIAAIIQARMGSKRLPGKSMMPLAGKPMLYRVIERVKRAKLLHKVILATTELPEDDVLCEVARELKIDVFRGSENDLVDRYYQCAMSFCVNTAIVRICADNPLIESEEIDRIITAHKRFYEFKSLFSKNPDRSIIFSNTHNINNNGYPDGLGAEVYTHQSFGGLDHYWKYLTDDEKEHPHKIFFENDSVKTCKCPKNMQYPHLKLDVNTKEEYDFVSSIYDKFGHNDFHFLDYVESIDNANSDVQQHGAGNI